MDSKKSYIPLKVFISYLALIALVASAGWILYSQNHVFSDTENKIAAENSRVLKVSSLLSNMYKTESFARITIQTDSKKDFNAYLKQTNALKLEIDSLKDLVSNDDQKVLLDSVKYLLSIKTANIRQLKIIKNKANDEVAVRNAINDITRMEGSLHKLRIEDFVKDPESLGEYEKNVLIKYVDYMNQNIPNDSTNTLSQKALDSVLIASKTLLSDVKRETEKRKKSLNSEENKLLQNELTISSQLRKILSVIETEIIINTTKSNADKEIALKKTNEVVSIAAIIGFLLTVFFSVLILNDFSKTQSYKKRLEIASSTAKKLLRNREQLISTVSHDLKTPLSTIIGYSELLSNSELNSKQAYYTTNIKGSSDYISKLVQDLVDFTQIEAGKITIEHIAFSLSQVINEVAQSIQDVYASKNLELIVNIDSDLQNKIVGDPFRLRQILSNIIGNAFKFTENGSIKIDATTEVGEHLLLIKIQDSGIGIKEKNQKLIFEEFTQADKSIEKRYGGTGLGLTISKRMAEILGGSLNLHSTFGKGSTFEIRIPLQYDTSTLITEIVQKKSDKQLTAIIIDDDNSLLKLTTEVLRQNHYIIIPFSHASTALDALETTVFDVIITDIQMPDIDGFEFIKKLKSNKTNTYDKQPIIALTGRTDLGMDVYYKAGFTTLIRKPYSPQALLKVIEAVINSTEIPEITIVSATQNSDSSYSIESLKAFIPNDPNALKEVLLSFIKETRDNTAILESAFLHRDYTKIKETAHKMHTMFRQLQATEISTTLKNMELQDHSASETAATLEALKVKINIFIAQVEADLIV